MERLTVWKQGGVALLAEGVTINAAVEKLAQAEVYAASLQERQAALTAELTALRARGQDKTDRFRELTERRLDNEKILAALHMAGLTDA